jgi:energy-coupling factor transporter ATP-binding protein EcfA2
MEINVTNFKGIHSATLVAAPIALICGHNGQGKSSIIEALAAAFASRKQPYGLTKEDMGQMVHTGEEIAEVLIKDDDRELSARWPAGEFMARGRPFNATAIATGDTLYSNLDSKERMKLLARYLKTEPDKAALAATWQERDPKVTDSEIDAMWAKIQKLGWDGAMEAEAQEGTMLKGQWRGITKDNYGTKVGGTWRPEGWTDDHEITTLEDLTRDRKSASEALEKAIGKVAINDQEKARLEALVKNIPKLKQAVDEREKEVARLAFIYKKAEADIKKIPILPDENWPACPHCKGLVQVMGSNQLQKAPAPMSAKDRKTIEDQLAQATGIFNNVLGEYNAAVNSRDTAVKDLETAKKSKATLEGSDPAAVSPEQIAEYREEIERCDSIINVKQRITESIRIHMEIIRKSVIVKILAPDGLRAEKLRESLDAFNQELAELCALADWATISILPDGAVQRGTYRYAMSSMGEQMQCDVLMQVALGMRDGSELFLVDQADMLDHVGRNGLFALLQHTGQKAVVAMMLLSRKAAPDLEAAGIGQTYWIENAVAHDRAA